MADQLRVMTINLLAADQADYEARRVVLKQGLESWQPDIVALQETVWGNGYDQAADLLGDGYAVVRHLGQESDGVGAALASRWPMGKPAQVDLRLPPRADLLPWAAALAVEIEAPEPIGRLLFVHRKPTWQVGFAHEREQQSVASARFVEQQLDGRDLHVVLAGDFDDTPDSSSIRFWTGRQSLDGTSVAYRDAWEALHPEDPGHTFTPENPLVRAGQMPLEIGRRIDYVMVRCGTHGPTLDVAACSRVFDEPVDGVWGSDHFGVVADLRVPDHPPGSWA